MVGQRISLVVTVKAYPALSQKYGEVVCVAGIRTDTPSPEWVRLFPVGFRSMHFDQQFEKYRHITVEAAPHTGDRRPETLRPNVDSLEVGEFLSSTNGWAARRPYVEPLLVDSMCEVLRRQQADGMSLAAFRPGEITDLVADDADAWTARQSDIAAQPSLFYPGRAGLEAIPFRWRYRYRCSPSCNGHFQSMVDWELSESFRKWRQLYEQPVLMEKIRQKYLDEMCAPAKDTIFFVGNQHRHLRAFLVLGVFWPPAL